MSPINDGIPVASGQWKQNSVASGQWKQNSDSTTNCGSKPSALNDRGNGAEKTSTVIEPLNPILDSRLTKSVKQHQCRWLGKDEMVEMTMDTTAKWMEAFLDSPPEALPLDFTVALICWRSELDSLVDKEVSCTVFLSGYSVGEIQT